ncbi:MAG TPA: redoxin domain-containing protein, partial [Bacteroidetes bacterium]|nr:redoxin domain-containing protein [Bacteroidota bacterium]
IFNLHTDYNDLQNIKVKGSEDNKLFFDYLKYISEKNKLAQDLANKKKQLEDNKQDISSVNQEIEKLDQEVKSYQRSLITKYPNTLTALLIKANMDIDIPEFTGTKDEVDLKRYYYYRKHYFDNIDFKNSAVLYTPFIHNKIETYIDKLTVPVPDSINITIDSLLKKMPFQSEVWKYYVSYFLNKYARSNYIGMDAVYVHMAKEYYGKGLTPWVDEKSLIRILDNALRMEGVLIGKTAPNVTLYTKDSLPVKIGDIQAKYLVLLFWKPDCGHCKHAMPDIVKFAKEYKNKGVKVATICTKLGKKAEKCWEGVKDLDMEGLDYNLADPKNLSGFHAEYNVRATPTIFVLDKDKKILIKQIPADKLGEVIDNIIKQESQDK